MDTILVTGGCGYIGSHTCVSLVENNFKVLIIDSMVNSYNDVYLRIKEIIDKKGIDSNKVISLIKGDLRNKEWLESVFFDYSISHNPIKSVIHFAGLKSIESSIKNPLEYWDTNISITLSLLSVMKKYQCFNIIFSSSASVYKPNRDKKFKENDKLEPNTPYGKTKLTIELILQDLFNGDLKKIWRIANLRYFNPVAAHDSGLLRENPKSHSSNLFPSIMRVLKGQEKKLFVYGNNWPTKDGTCVRDFIHVMDLAEAHISAYKYLLSNAPQIVSLNIGTGQGNTIMDVINIFNEKSTENLSYEFVEKRSGDEPYVVADNSLALNLLDWTPNRNLSDMCTDSINSNL